MSARVKILVFTNLQKAFEIDYLRQVRKESVTFIRDAESLRGLAASEVIVLKRMYGVYVSRTQELNNWEINREISLRNFNLIDLT